MSASPAVCHLLLVEDDASISDVVSTALGDEGYRVTVAPDFTQAVAGLTAARFDFVLADTLGASVRREEADRWRELDRIRALACDTPVVLFTAHNPQLFANFRAHGFHDLLPKPFSLDDLSAIVSRYVENECAREPVDDAA